MARVWQQVGPVFRDMWLNMVVSGAWLPRRLRAFVLQGTTGHQIRLSAAISPRVFLGAWQGLTLGDRTFINYGCFFDLGAETTLGDRCSVGYEVMFVTCSHEIGDSSQRAGQARNRPITIGDGVWIGARSVILPGVTVGNGAIIGAGSVVDRDCEANGIYAGVPARLVRKLEAAS
jgi:maltose O-acetyltransferase